MPISVEVPVNNSVRIPRLRRINSTSFPRTNFASGAARRLCHDHDGESIEVKLDW